MTQPDQADVPSAGLSRRDMLKRGAVVGFAAAWTVPLLQVVSMTPAHADSPSAPPVNPPPVTPPADTSTPVVAPPPENPPPVVTPPAVHTPPAHQSNTPAHPSKPPAPRPNVRQAVASPAPVGGSALPAAGESTLANTGATYPVAPAVGAGAAAIALGAGALAAARAMKVRQSAAADAAAGSDRGADSPAGGDQGAAAGGDRG